MDKLKYTPDNITHLGKDEIFVFGSNLAGNHAGGAARIAREKFGAIMGQGEGLQGQSYAIPTMQGGVETIKPYVDQFIEFARECDQNTFYVTRIGCGIAGFKDEDIAPLFEDALELYNVRLPKSFVDVILRNREKRIKEVLTPWPVRDYGVYNLLVDLMLANDAVLSVFTDKSLNRRVDLLKNNISTIKRSNYLMNYPDRELIQYLEEHKSDIVSGHNEKTTLCMIGKCCEINHVDLVRAAINRYAVAQAYNLTYLILRTVDFSKEFPFGWAGSANFEYVLFGTITGRWSCGDNSYMYEDMGKCLAFFCDELTKHSEEVTSNGNFDRDKFLNFVSQPYIWQFCHENDGHALHEITMMEGILNQLDYQKEYREVDNYFIPTNNFSRPVYELAKGRLSFPTYYIKERFIKMLLAKSDNETLRKGY